MAAQGGAARGTRATETHSAEPTCREHPVNLRWTAGHEGGSFAPPGDCGARAAEPRPPSARAYAVDAFEPRESMAGRRIQTYTHLFGGTVWNQVRREPGGVESGLRRSSRRQQGARTGADRQARARGVWRHPVVLGAIPRRLALLPLLAPTVPSVSARLGQRRSTRGRLPRSALLVRALTPYTQLHQTGGCRFSRRSSVGPPTAILG
jgi:hypothetical protein